MAKTDIGSQVRDVATLNNLFRSLGQSTSSWAGSLSKALKDISDVQSTSADHTKQLEEAQGKILEQLGEEITSRKSLDRLMDEAGRKRLSFLEQYKRKWKQVEKDTDKIGKKMIAHFGVSLVTAAQKAAEKIKKLFSLSGIWSVFKKGVAIATGALASIVAIAKQVGQVILKHVTTAFSTAANMVKKASGMIISFFRKVWDTITMGGGEIRQAVAEMAQALGFFNNEMGQAMGFLQANRREWYQWGLSVGEAAKYVIELNKSYGKFLGFGAEAKRLYKDHIMMSRALGLEAESAGKLNKSLTMMGTSIKEFTMNLVGTLGPGGGLQEMGAFIPEIARDIADSGEELAMLGEEGRKTFVAGAVWVRQYHLAIKDLTAMMDKFDTLSSAAENVSKLNQMFGVTINAMDMLVDTDPAARLEKVQKQLLGAGKSWETMDYFQRKSLSSMMGINAQQAQLVFSSQHLGKSRQEIARAMEEEDKKQADSQKRQAEVMNAILSQLRASRGIMGSIMPIFYRVWVAFGRMFKGFLWGGRRGLLMFAEEWAQGIRKSFAPDSPGGKAWSKMTKSWVKGWQSTMKSFGKSWGEMWANIDMEQFGKDFYGTIDSAINAIKQILADLFPDFGKAAKDGASVINNVIHGIATRLQGIFKWVGEHGADIIRDIGRVAKEAFGIVKKVFNFFDKSNWGEAANIMKGLFHIIASDAAKILGYTNGISKNMFDGLDPAVAGAKVLEMSYKGIRNIVIEIFSWWKKHGDEIKDTFKSIIQTAKPYFQLSMQIGKYVGKLVEFLAANPMLLKVVAAAKIGSMLGGVGMGQMLGGLASFVRGPRGAMETVGEAPTRGGAAGYVAGQTAMAGRGLLRAGAGGLAGYGLGAAAEQLTGVKGLSTIGAGVGAGSMFGPLGAAIGGLTGLIVETVKSGSGLVAMAQQAKEAARQKVMKKMFAEIEKSTKAHDENIQNIIIENKLKYKTNELQKIQIVGLQKQNEYSIAQIDKLKAQMNVDNQRLETQKKIAESELASIADPDIRRSKQAEIDGIIKEIDYRSQMNKALEESIAYQAIMNESKLAELEAAKLEADGRVATTEAQNQIAADQQRIQEATAENLETVQTRMASLMDAFSPQNIASWATSGDPEAINKGFEQALTEVNRLKDTGTITSDIAEQLTQSIRDRYKSIQGKEMSGEGIQKLFSEMYTDLQTNLESAVGAGNFKEAQQLQQRIKDNEAMISENTVKIQTYRAQAAALERDATKAYMAALSSDPPIKPEELDAFIRSQVRIPTTPTLGSPKAFGGLVTKATRALIGEAGPELVMPLRRGPVTGSPGAESMIQDYLGRMGGGENNKGKKETLVSLPVVINLDGRKVGEALVRTAVRSVA